MKLNVEELAKFIQEKFHNNQAYCAEELGVNKSYLNLILNKKINNDSGKIIVKLIEYCKRNNIDYDRFIFLD